MPQDPLARVTVLDSLVDRLQQQILSGALAVGQQLPGEAAIAADWGVSRPVVREALALMRERGYLRTVNGIGTYVRHPDVSHVAAALERLLERPQKEVVTVDHLYEARQAIEVNAARMSASRSTESDRDELRRYVGEMSRNRADPALYAAADLGFHVAIARSSRNPLLPTLLAPLVRTIVEGIVKSHRTPDAVLLGLEGHGVILDQIIARDGELAADAMRQHLEDSRRVFPEGILLRPSKGRLLGGALDGC